MTPFSGLLLRSKKKQEEQKEITLNDPNGFSAISSASKDDSLYSPLFHEKNNYEIDTNENLSDSDSLFNTIPETTPKTTRNRPTIQSSERTRRMREEKEKDEIRQKELSDELRRRNSKTVSRNDSISFIHENQHSIHTSVKNENNIVNNVTNQYSKLNDGVIPSEEQEQKLRDDIDRRQKRRTRNGLDGSYVLFFLLLLVLSIILHFCYVSAKNNPRITYSFCIHNMKLCLSLTAREVRARF